ncbi:MAG: Lipoprotein-anchoring transpeptidase ErfK/SrfK [Akkermansiaceae bacterium]|nr:Lipoprotein-anchoring transpeptidase ErfK/SrfK [Akkermansiaceae bacterium]
MKLQIFLDAQGFGPGVVDGRRGEFTDKALDLYRQSKGLSPDWHPDLDGAEAYTTYEITAKDLSNFGGIPAEPAAVAKLEKLPYENLTELLGERFHTTRAFIRELNPGVNIDALQPGGSVRVPAIARPFRSDLYPSQYAPSSDAGKGRRVLVDTKYRMLQVFDGSRILAAFPITPGSPEHPANPGELKVVGAVPWPWYRYDEGVLDRGERTENFFNYPPGPNSPVGVLWTGLNRPGVGIHGTSNPETIGRAGSHGCIRLSNWDAAAFYTLVRKGMPVTIQ